MSAFARGARAPEIFPVRVPSPMLARLARELPVGAFSYEPKWDGFRCIAAIERGEVALWSRHGRPLARYFPELVEAFRALGADAAIDGEIVVVRPGGRFDFGALLGRVSPVASRVERLRAAAPASFVAFDVLAERGADVAAEPFLARRARLERLLSASPPAIVLTPATRDPQVARGWLDRFPGGGIDGVVAKADDLPYAEGKRAMVKVKRLRSADCVVAGLRLFADEPVVASLLLGLWDGAELRHVGVAASFPEARRRELYAELRGLAVPLAGHPWQRGFNLEGSPVGRLGGSAGRWDPATMALDWTPLAPERVCEVAFDQLDGARFRHPARFLRWRPDREAASCSIAQLAPPAGDQR